MTRILLIGASVAIWTAQAVGAPALAAPGDLDDRFSTDGIAYSPAIAKVTAVTVDPSGRPVVVGKSSGGGTKPVVVGRYGDSGEPDDTFSGSGFVRPKLGRIAAAHDVAADLLGSILIAGRVDGRAAVVRLTANGALDGSFGDQGVVRLAARFAKATAVAVDPNGRILVGVERRFGGGRLLRLERDGRSDLQFGSGGEVNGPGDYVRAVQPLPDGSVLFGGSGVVKLTTSGQRDPSFGTNGSSGILSGTLGNGVESIAVAQDGSVVAGVMGVSLTGPGAGAYRYVAKLSPSGQVLFNYFGLRGSRVALGADSRVFAASSPQSPVLPTGPALGAALASGEADRAFGAEGLSRIYSGVLGGSAADLTVDLQGRPIVAVNVEGASAALARLESAPGPSDHDADGIEDVVDPCPYGYAPEGCRTTRPTVRLRRYSGRAFAKFGPRAPCDAGTRLTLYRTRPGFDRRLSRVIFRPSLRSSDAGYYLADLHERIGDGSYYVEASPNQSALATCAAARSKVVAWP
ncbi:MAG: hypothetical protein QOI10_1899 [Solirubrobacterales bacterium]|nr:hypothetical protein [Solirubrobacterales bacterium]